MKIGDSVASLVGLPVGTWAEDFDGSFWSIREPEHPHCPAGDGCWSVPKDDPYNDSSEFGPFTICRPPVGAVLPSARYAPEGTWLQVAR